MKNWLKLCLLFGIVILYVIVINIFASLISFPDTPQSNSATRISGADLEIGVSQLVSVQVTRAKKWWGRGYENNGNSYLHIFELFLIPKKIQNYNFIYFHIIFLTILILLTILMFTKKSHKEEKNEKCGEDSDNLGTLIPIHDN